MTEAEIKEKINADTKRSCLPDAKEVYVRHCTESVSCKDISFWGGLCFLIHPDVSLVDFFSVKTGVKR